MSLRLRCGVPSGCYNVYIQLIYIVLHNTVHATPLPSWVVNCIPFLTSLGGKLTARRVHSFSNLMGWKVTMERGRTGSIVACIFNPILIASNQFQSQTSSAKVQACPCFSSSWCSWFSTPSPVKMNCNIAVIISFNENSSSVQTQWFSYTALLGHKMVGCLTPVGLN